MDNLSRGLNINLHPTAVFVHAFRSRNCVSLFFVASVQTKYKREDSGTYTGPEALTRNAGSELFIPVFPLLILRLSIVSVCSNNGDNTLKKCKSNCAKPCFVCTVNLERHLRQKCGASAFLCFPDVLFSLSDIIHIVSGSVKLVLPGPCTATEPLASYSE